MFLVFLGCESVDSELSSCILHYGVTSALHSLPWNPRMTNKTSLSVAWNAQLHSTAVSQLRIRGLFTTWFWNFRLQPEVRTVNDRLREEWIHTHQEFHKFTWILTTMQHTKKCIKYEDRSRHTNYCVLLIIPEWDTRKAHYPCEK